MFNCTVRIPIDIFTHLLAPWQVTVKEGFKCKCRETHLQRKHKCTAGLQFDWFGFSSFSKNKQQHIFFLVKSIPVMLESRGTVILPLW